MDVRYSRDYKHNYLIISDDRVLEDDYQLRMLTKNKIDGLLPCQERMINGEGLLYYEITSKQSLKVIFDTTTVGIKELRNIFIKLKQVFDKLSKFLLKEDKLMLSPEYIYMDIESGECLFLYYPFHNLGGDILKPLSDFCLEHVNSEDVEAVEAVYQLSDIILRQHLGINEILTWFEDEFGERVEDTKIDDSCDIVQNRETPLDYFNEFEEYDFSEEPKRMSIIQRIKAWFHKEEEEDIFEELPKPCPVRNAAYHTETSSDKSENAGTVYIPWMENSEQKLYGLGRNNKFHIDLNKAPLTIGKLREKVDMVIMDESISRMHARFLRQGNKYMLQDLNSLNGCYRNGMRLEPNEIVTIEPGDEIGLGKLKFIYR